jgi:hypothetical protein
MSEGPSVVGQHPIARDASSIARRNRSMGLRVRTAVNGIRLGEVVGKPSPQTGHLIRRGNPAGLSGA